MKIVLIDNTAHHLFTQQHLYNSFTQAGHQLMLICPNDGDYFIKMQNMGYQCFDIALDGKSLNPINNLLLIKQLHRLFKQISPDIIFSFTIKPNIYSAIISKWLKIPVVPNITGLGYVFLQENLLTKLIVNLYKFAFSGLGYVVFQNKDDMQVFIDKQILSPHSTIISVPGSGVSLSKFPFVGYTNNSNAVTFLYSGRLLWDKGIGELIEAFRIVRSKYPEVKLKFIGNYFLANPAAIKPEEFEAWQRELDIEYLGMVDNVSEVIASVDCIVLPSYREGMPRAILEGSSMGKVVITTDAVGCRDSVEDEKTGYMCKVRDANDLADKMLKFMQLSIAQRQEMGVAGRKKMELEFDQNIVIDKYLSIAKTFLV